GILVVGGTSATGSASFSPKPVTGVATVADPLAYLAAPTPGVAQAAVNLTYGSLTLNPGVYSKINASGSSHLTLNPGIYIIAGGGFTVAGSASVSGTGVTIYNTNAAFPGSGGAYGAFTVSGSGTVSLTSPSSGSYAGVLLFQDRGNTAGVSISGSGVVGSSGTLYAPSAMLTLSGSGRITLPLIVDKLTLSGSASDIASAGSGSTGSVSSSSIQTLNTSVSSVLGVAIVVPPTTVGAIDQVVGQGVSDTLLTDLASELLATTRAKKKS
ncbi:hypothetical protein ACYOEI_41370, partial [Singulisphaera rosea]